jgi:hypothetical protein
MNEKQGAMLLDLISEWSGIVNDSFAAARMEEIKARLDEHLVAWSGPFVAIKMGRRQTTSYLGERTLVLDVVLSLNTLAPLFDYRYTVS